MCLEHLSRTHNVLHVYRYCVKLLWSIGSFIIYMYIFMLLEGRANCFNFAYQSFCLLVIILSEPKHKKTKTIDFISTKHQWIDVQCTRIITNLPRLKSCSFSVFCSFNLSGVLAQKWLELSRSNFIDGLISINPRRKA